MDDEAKEAQREEDEFESGPWYDRPTPAGWFDDNDYEGY